MKFDKEKIEHCAALVFPGSIAPRVNEFEYLSSLGIKITPIPPPNDRITWALSLQHPQWGTAKVSCLREAKPVPDVALNYSYQLLKSDRDRARRGLPFLLLEAWPTSGNPLRDRKTAFRWMRALLGSDGLIATERDSFRFWSPATLDEELSHDADLDIESLFTIHVVTADGKPNWFHTHGLAEVGLFDFDILRPSDFIGNRGAGDIARAIAYGIADEKISKTTGTFRLFSPTGEMRFVEVAEFNRRASAADRALRTTDPLHNGNRMVLCEPKAKKRFFNLFSRIEPSQALMKASDNIIVSFPTSATTLMAHRAMQTYPQFRRLSEEFAEFHVKPIVKLGYRIDGGGATDREHMWFEVHAMTDSSLDGTLTNQPRQIAAMKMGDRGQHDVSLLSDWIIFTPVGQITPRNFVPARVLRTLPPEQRAQLQKKVK